MRAPAQIDCQVLHSIAEGRFQHTGIRRRLASQVIQTGWYRRVLRLTRVLRFTGRMNRMRPGTQNSLAMA